MRHYLLARVGSMLLAPTPLAGGVPMRATAAPLVSLPGAPDRLTPTEPGTLTRAEHLAAVASGTHPHADPASSAVVHPNDRIAHARPSPVLDSTGEGAHKEPAEALPKCCRDGEGPG